MSLETEFKEYCEKLSKKYYDHLEFLMQYMDKKPFYEVILSNEIIDVLESNGYTILHSDKTVILRQMMKAIRKMPFKPYFPVANSKGYTKVNEAEKGLAWRQSMKERISSMQSQIKAFDEKFNYQEPNEDNQNLKITFAHESNA